MEAGHIGGTSHRNLLRTNENWRDLGRRSGDVSGMSVLVQKTCARDPAYRPGRLVNDRLPRVWPPAKLRSVNAGDVNNLLLVLTGVLVVLTGVVTWFARQTVQESQKATGLSGRQ